MRRLLLLGGGHAHLRVLAALARERWPVAQVTLLSPHARQLYSGLLPAHLAGHCTVDELAIPLPPLCEAAGVDFVQGAAAALDADARRVRLEDGRELDYELLSLDVGGVMDRDIVPGAREHALFLRPLEQLVALWPRLQALGRERALDVVMVGGGAAGVEVAMSLRHALPRARITLVSGGDAVLPGHAASARRRVERALAARDIVLVNDSATAIDAATVHLASGAALACDAPVVAVGSVGPPWLRGSGLALDAQGFVRTGPGLASVSHADAFAAGDVASRDDIERARSGVFAVRAGPALALNLRRALAGDAPLPHCPAARSLVLIGCGDATAIAAWGEWSAQGRALWWWKQRIDRRFVARYRLSRADGSR